MWIFLNDAFLSVVADHANLLVRARRREDLERTFPAAAHRILATPKADYGFRLSMPRSLVVAALLERLLDIDYPNFKASVAEDDRHAAYQRVWEDMFTFQEADPDMFREVDEPRMAFDWKAARAFVAQGRAEPTLDLQREPIWDAKRRVMVRNRSLDSGVERISTKRGKRRRAKKLTKRGM